jgi:predicted P-loop ATPase
MSELINALHALPKEWAKTPVTGDKRPYLTNWQNEPASIEAIAQELESGNAQGFGIITGKLSGGIMAIDCDGHVPHALFKEILGGDIPHTVAFTSGKDGRAQYLFSIPGEHWTSIKTKKEGDPKEGGQLELRWDGHQSVLPPSVHPTTGRYEWINSPDTTEIALLPDTVLAYLLKPKQHSKSLPNNEQKPNKPTPKPIYSSEFIPPIPIARCLSVAHREALESGINDGIRDNTGCSLARDLIGVASYVPSIQFDYKSRLYQLEVDGDPEQLLWDYCQRCSPPLDRSDFERIYKSAHDFNPSPSCDEESLKNCLRSWVKEHTPKKESSEKSDSNEATKDYQAIGQKLGINISDKGLDKDGSPVSKLLKLKLDLFDLFGERLRFNEMSREIELDNKPIDLTLAKDFVATALEYDSTTENCIIALNAVAINFKYHPVREYFESLRGKPVDLASIENFPAKYFGNDDPLQNRLFFRKLIATVGRVMQPGLKDDSLLVLQGKQGTGKSTLLKTLAGDDWFNDDLRSLEDKDEIAKLSRFWIMELAEVDYLFGKKEVELFKRFLSGTEDTFRPPYGRANITTKRSCGLFATTNKNEFLTDPTGDRRYWVVEVPNDVDTEAIKRDRDLIWATAIALYERGDRHFLTPDEREAHAVANTNWRDDSDPWNASILNNLSVAIKTQGSIEYVCLQVIFDTILHIPVERQDKRNRNRIGNCLQTAGFERKPLRIDGKLVKLWVREQGASCYPCYPTQKRWVTTEISPLYTLYLCYPCYPSFKTFKFENEKNGVYKNDGNEREMDTNPVIGESCKKMGNMGNNEKEQLERASSNDPKCYPSFEELGNNEKMGNKLEMSNRREGGTQVGLIACPEPEAGDNGHKTDASVVLIPEVLATKTSKHQPSPETLKVGDRVKYIGTNPALQKQYAGVLKVHEVSNDGYACLKPDGGLTSWIEAADLQLVED